MKYIQLSIDIQRFLHYETGMLVSANAVQECGGPPWWYACYLWLHCMQEEFMARSVRGCSIRRIDWYYKGNITIITFKVFSMGSPG